MNTGRPIDVLAWVDDILIGAFGIHRADVILRGLRERLDKQISFLFDVDEESDAPDYDGSIPQALFLLNGTFVNGEKVEQRRELNNGDRIKIGTLELEVRLTVAAATKLVKREGGA